LSNVGEEPFAAIGNADFDLIRLAIREYLDIQNVGSVPHYSPPSQQVEVGQHLQPTEGIIPLFSVQSLYVVELKLLLRARLPRQTHARRMHNPSPSAPPTPRLPLNALALVGVVSFLLSIIDLISTTTFNAIISLQAMTLSVLYILPIFFLALRRIRRHPPQPRPFGCGRCGPVINLRPSLFDLRYHLDAIPTSATRHEGQHELCGPLLGAVIVGAPIDRVIGGHKRFQVPTARTV
jgi:hypothetical protein